MTKHKHSRLKKHPLSQPWERGQAALESLRVSLSTAAVALAIKALVDGDQETAETMADRALDEATGTISAILPVARRVTADVLTGDVEATAIQMIRLGEILTNGESQVEPSFEGMDAMDDDAVTREDTRPKRLEHLDAVGPVQAGRLRTFTDEASDEDGSS